MNKKQATEVLDRTPWFAELPMALKSELVARCDLIHLESRSALYHEGDEPGGIFGVARGYIEYHILSLPEEETLGHIAGPGYWFGELATSRGAPRRVSVIANTDCWLLRLAAADVKRIANTFPDLWYYLLQISSANLALAIDIVDSLKRTDPVQRVAKVLLTLSVGGMRGEVPFRISHSEIASIASLSRRSVQRAVNTLQSRGWIHHQYATIEIRERQSLLRFVETEA